MLDTRYADREHVTLVCDNLNTHTKGAFYEAFEPDRARAYVKRIDFCYTPKHGSWLNVAECELSCLTSQCLRDRRIGELTELRTEIATWADKTNAKQRGVDWQFRIEDARVKLKRLYPKIADRQRIVELGWSFFRHRITPGNARANRQRPRDQVSVSCSVACRASASGRDRSGTPSA